MRRSDIGRERLTVKGSGRSREREGRRDGIEEEERGDGKRDLFPRYVGASQSYCTHGQFRTTLIDCTIERRGHETATTGILEVSIGSS